MSIGGTLRFSVLGLALLGCGAGDGIFRKDGFYPQRHPYRVIHSKGGDLLAKNGWIVDNYERDGAAYGDEKTTPRYRALARIDQNEDGVADVEFVFPTYDLLLRHARHAGRIWIRTLPLPPELEATELRVLALDFIDALARSGPSAAALSSERAYGRRDIVTRVLEGYDATLDGERAYEVTFESADAAQVHFADDGRYMRTRLIAVRPDFDFHHGRERFPLLMLIAYSNRAEDFERGNADFERLVAGVDILSERELIEGRAAKVFECADDKVKSLSVYIDVDRRGRVEWADTQAKRERSFEKAPIWSCAHYALHRLRLRDKGERRRLVVKLERDRQVRPAAGYARVPKLVQGAKTAQAR
jgi:hypothetical protein